MEVLLKICSISFLGVIIIGLLRKSLPEISTVASITVLVVISIFSYGLLQSFYKFVIGIATDMHISNMLLLPLIKASGISIVSKLACDMCREGGLNSAASYIELISAVIALSFSFPMIDQFLGQILG